MPGCDADCGSQIAVDHHLAAALSKVGFKGGSESNLQPIDFRSATYKSMGSTISQALSWSPVGRFRRSCSLVCPPTPISGQRNLTPLKLKSDVPFWDYFRMAEKAEWVGQRRRGCLANRAKVRQMRSSQLAIARPISSGLSSCTKWRPPTTTRC
jgi:hypothetical protein